VGIFIDLDVLRLRDLSDLTGVFRMEWRRRSIGGQCANKQRLCHECRYDASYEIFARSLADQELRCTLSNTLRWSRTRLVSWRVCTQTDHIYCHHVRTLDGVSYILTAILHLLLLKRDC
jgi:hypothetical protein